MKLKINPYQQIGGSPLTERPSCSYLTFSPITEQNIEELYN